MPRAAPRACSHPACPHGQPCPVHPPASWSAGARGRKMPPGWDATRARVLARDHHACRLRYPCCTGTATEVHHTRRGVEDEATLLSACASCHAVVTSWQALAARGLAQTPAPPVP